MTQRASTFTGKELDRELAKVLEKDEAATFKAAVLAQPAVVALHDRESGKTLDRFTTQEIRSVEAQALDHAAARVADRRHQVSADAAARALSTRPTIRDEQRRAFAHATGAAGLAIIDGKAGTGKSYTMGAIRAAYEADGCRVIGLAPTNIVAQDMQRDGFTEARTVHSALFALKNDRDSWNARTVVMVDEAAMIGTRILAELLSRAEAAGAKLILVGDDRQLASIERGGMFGELREGFGAATLAAVTRQQDSEHKAAAEMLARGEFAEAVAVLDGLGCITRSNHQTESLAALVEQWKADTKEAPDKSRMVFAYTNDAVLELNAALRVVRKERGELGEDHTFTTKDGEMNFAVNDRIIFSTTDKRKGITNGATGIIEDINGTNITLQFSESKTRLTFDAAEVPAFRHAYAATIYKGQGRTLDEVYLYHSEHWKDAAAYVALTRHRDEVKLFVSTELTRDNADLAGQLARHDDRRASLAFATQGEAERQRIEQHQRAAEGVTGFKAAPFHNPPPPPPEPPPDPQDPRRDNSRERLARVTGAATPKSAAELQPPPEPERVQAEANRRLATDQATPTPEPEQAGAQAERVRLNAEAARVQAKAEAEGAHSEAVRVQAEAQAELVRLDAEAARIQAEAEQVRLDAEAARVQAEAELVRLDAEAARIQAEAEQVRLDAEAARVQAEAEQVRLDAEAARIQAEAGQVRLDAEAARIQAEAEQVRLDAEAARVQAEAELVRLDAEAARIQAEAELVRLDAEAARVQAEAELVRLDAEAARVQAEAEQVRLDAEAARVQAEAQAEQQRAREAQQQQAEVEAEQQQHREAAPARDAPAVIHLGPPPAEPGHAAEQTAERAEAERRAAAAPPSPQAASSAPGQETTRTTPHERGPEQHREAAPARDAPAVIHLGPPPAEPGHTAAVAPPSPEPEQRQAETAQPRVGDERRGVDSPAVAAPPSPQAASSAPGQETTRTTPHERGPEQHREAAPARDAPAVIHLGPPPAEPGHTAAVAPPSPEPEQRQAETAQPRVGDERRGVDSPAAAAPPSPQAASSAPGQETTRTTPHERDPEQHREAAPARDAPAVIHLGPPPAEPGHTAAVAPPSPEPEQRQPEAAQQPAREDRQEADRRAAAALAATHPALAPNPTPSISVATTDAGMVAQQQEARALAERRGGLLPAAAPATKETERAQQDKAEADRRAAALAARREQALKSLQAAQAQKEKEQTENRTNTPPSGRTRTR